MKTVCFFVARIASAIVRPRPPVPPAMATMAIFSRFEDGVGKEFNDY